ncbi:MAG: GNAT family N-acetyltransferase [Clostridiales bacterium]|nr:GNAT family N-acetyltransferase [Clostridiales bacterium]
MDCGQMNRTINIPELMIDESLRNYIETNILPLYDDFDAAHQRNHVDMVIEQSMTIAADLDVDMNMVYAIAAYHDTGLTEDRKTHHIVSGRIVREDMWLRDWFSEEQIETMAQACEDHRASSDHEPRSIYGKIVAEADRFIDPDTIILRTVQYGLANYPELDKEGHWERTLNHLHEKYAEGGYLRLWFENSPNVARLNTLREIIKDELLLREKFDYLYDALINPHLIGCTCPECQRTKHRKVYNIRTIENERLKLRNWKLDDADALFKYASDQRVSELALWPHHTSVEMSRDVIEKIFLPNPHNYAIVLNETGEPVGCIGLVPVGEEHHEVLSDEREIGYWIGFPYWNKGLTTEALESFINYCRDNIRLKSLLITTDNKNKASQRVAEKCGFQFLEEYFYNGIPGKAYRLILQTT